MKFFIVLGIISSYFGIMLGTYVVLSKVLPYTPDDDPYDDGDFNKGVAAFWPLGIPFMLIVGMLYGCSRLMERIRKEITAN